MPQFIPKFEPKDEQQRFRIEHNETTGWVTCENASMMSKAQTKVRWEQLQDEGLNPNLLRVRRDV